MAQTFPFARYNPYWDSRRNAPRPGETDVAKALRDIGEAARLDAIEKSCKSYAVANTAPAWIWDLLRDDQAGDV